MNTRRSILTTLAAAAALLLCVLLPAGALARPPASGWILPKGVLACHREQVPRTKPQTVTFSLSTDVAYVYYVGRGCMTLLIAGGPDNQTIGADLGTFYNVDLTPATVYRVGTRRVSFAHLFAGPKVLDRNAGPFFSLTLIGRFSRNYAPLRATQVVLLPRGKQLPS